MTKRQSLKEKEKLFCFYYCRTRNIREAAAKAGYTLFPEKAGQKLIRDKRITAEIKKLEKLQEVSQREAAAGYRRIAYGSVCDAIRLLSPIRLPNPVNLKILIYFAFPKSNVQKAGAWKSNFSTDSRHWKTCGAFRQQRKGNSSILCRTGKRSKGSRCIGGEK